MRILTILGSPRASGNTSHVLTWVEQTLRSHAHSVERVMLYEHRIEPCRECRECREKRDGSCAIQDDDANAIMQKMLKADVIVIACPVFCWGFPSQLKALLERTYCLVEDYDHNPEYSSKLAKKAIALIVTCGGPEEGNAELLIRAFYSLVRFLKAVPIGHLLYPFFRTPEDLTTADRNRATQFALRVVARE